ncbi:MAG: Hsp20/alpha crystallin family protein [Acholeplasma sp.]|nr:Hsp20/alpha crystallin family protein [Acholeplasma sp.]
MLSLWKKERDFFDSLFDDLKMTPSFSNNTLLKTDIKENDGNYVLSIDLPGFDKEDVKVSIEDGYLTVEASREDEKVDESKNERYIRKERYYGTAKRSFYVGNINIEDVKGSFDKNVLTLEIPKEQQKLPEKKYLELS